MILKVESVTHNFHAAQSGGNCRFPGTYSRDSAQSVSGDKHRHNRLYLKKKLQNSETGI